MDKIFNTQRPLAVANYFIQKGMLTGKLLGTLELQRLMYVAHSLMLALNRCPLFTEEFEARQYGPVLPSIQHEFATFTSHKVGINCLGTIIQYVGDDKVPGVYAPQITDPTGYMREFLERVWNVYSGHTVEQMKQITKSENSPWAKIVDQYDGIDNLPQTGAVIPNKDIKTSDITKQISVNFSLRKQNAH